MNFFLLFGGGFGVGEGQRTESPVFETWTFKSHIGTLVRQELEKWPLWVGK